LFYLNFRTIYIFKQPRLTKNFKVQQLQFPTTGMQIQTIINVEVSAAYVQRCIEAL